MHVSLKETFLGNSANEMRGKTLHKLPGPGSPEGGPGPDFVAHVLTFSVLSDVLW